MASINFSGVSNVLEASPALVNFKFDFSLRKVEAPPEFRELGELLNLRRRDDAENGRLHITARRLGVLFEGVTPSTPALIKAYGLRASEIAKAIKKDEKAQSFAQGIFSHQAGFDAASIWAGATSGSGAIQVHLLACMLARIWPSSEATSIWAEILHVRRKKIVDDFESTGSADLRLLSEARQSLDRHQLAEWDASARAWLRIADNAKNRQQKKLLLIIANLNQPVNSRPVLYDGVIRAWVAGLMGMEALISGTPSDMESGELLLALSSWHIYPNLLVLEPLPQSVEQQDPLVPASGTLTIGLRRRVLTTTDSGLHWSLPLAHLQYYGDPEMKQGKVTRVGQRLSLAEFNMAVLGCVLGSWEIKNSDLVSVVNWIRKLSDMVEGYFLDHTRPEVANKPGMPTPLRRVNHFDKSWLFYLGSTARDFLDSTDFQRQIYTQLLKLGKSRSMFLGSPGTSFFGLSDLKIVAPLATTEQKVRLFRSQAAAFKVPHADAIIHYVSTETGLEEFASATVKMEKTKKRSSSSDDIEHRSGHCRWVRSKPLPLALPLTRRTRDSLPTTMVTMADIYSQGGGTGWDAQSSVMSPTTYPRDARNLTSHRPLFEQPSTVAAQPQADSSDFDTESSEEMSRLKSADEMFAAQRLRYNAMGEVVRPVEAEPLKAVINSNGSSWIEWGLHDLAQHWINDDDWMSLELTDSNERWSDLEISYELWLGSSDSTAIYIRTGVPHPPATRPLSLAELHMLLDEDGCTANLAMQVLKGGIDATNSSYIDSLRTLATVSDMYSNFCGATIDVNVFSSTIPMHWTQQDPGSGDGIFLRQDYKGTCQEKNMLASHAGAQRDDRLLFKDSILGSRHDGLFNASAVRCKFFCDLCFSKFFRCRPMTSRMSFSCILWFESALQLNPEDLDAAIALSSGNSLFIATAVTCDPTQSANMSQVQHVMGNVGRPGISILVPPEKPHVKKLGLDVWNVLEFADWNGQVGNSFPESSLHVWFTGATRDIDIGHRGRQDKELVAVESVVTLHSRGQWVTDLPIQAAKEALRTVQPWITGLAVPGDGKSLTDVVSITGPALQCHKKHDRDYCYKQFKLAAIKSWDELLQSNIAAESDCIFLARNNWQARLSALMIALARGQKVYLLPQHVCWECTKEEYASDGESAQTVLFIA